MVLGGINEKMIGGQYHTVIGASCNQILESMPDGLLIVERAGQIILANAQAVALFGYDRSQLLQKSIEMLMPERFRSAHKVACAQFFRNPLVRPMGIGLELYGLHQDGSEFPVDISLSPLDTKEGLLVVCSIRDVTERKRAEAVIHRSTKQLRALAQRLAEAQEAERKELARELHDQVGQNLTALDFHLNAIHSQLAGALAAEDQARAHLDTSLELLAQTAKRIRDVMADLRPPVLDDYGLVAALRWYADRFFVPQGISVSVEETGPTLRSGTSLDLMLFRIAQEALTNVVRHARAKKVTIRLDVDSDQMVRLVVTDDGIGFDITTMESAADRPSWGLLGMKERAEAIGGHCRIESHPGQGTRVIVEVPQ